MDRREYYKKWHEEHKEYASLKMKEYWEKNKDLLKKKKKEYYESHKEETKKQVSDYLNTVSGKASKILGNCNSVDKLKGFGKPNITKEQIMEIIVQPCHWCGQTDWTKNALDRLDNSKGHNIDNVVCSCWECNKKRGIEYHSRNVLQCEMNGNVLQEYKSAREAWRITGVAYQNIGKCCMGKLKSAGGYIWKYKDETTD